MIAALLVLYGNWAISNPKQCFSDDSATKEDVTMTLLSIFRICFCIHFIEFLNSAIAGPILQLYENSKNDHLASVRVEYLLRVFVIFMVILQNLYLLKSKGQGCFKSDLSLESDWMFVLSFLQAFYTVIFLIWRLCLKSEEAYAHDLNIM